MNKDASREISYQTALWPSARVLRHCPDGRLHMRLRGRNTLEKRMMKGAMCDSHETVKRAGDDQRAISVEMYSGDKVEVGIQCFGASPCVECVELLVCDSLDKLRAPFAAFHIFTSPSQPPDTSCVPSVL